MIDKKTVLTTLGALLLAGPALGAVDCDYKGATYSNGSAVCQSGSQYRCDDGQWSGLAIACTEKAAIGRDCAFNGSSYSPGAASCQSGTQYRCDDGGWTGLGIACTGSGQLAAGVPPDGRTCMYNEATVATGSTICKAGVTFRCDDGDWHNLGTSCR